jgi:SepF-like predicted cell division protein (DUF552 family)
MLGLIKKLFGSKPAETSAPYKVESTDHFPFPKAVKEEEKPAVKAKRPAAKKPTAKKTVVKKTTP